MKKDKIRLLCIIASITLMQYNVFNINCYADIFNNAGTSSELEPLHTNTVSRTRDTPSQLEGVKFMSTGNKTDGSEGEDGSSGESNSSDGSGLGITNTAAVYSQVDLSGDQLKYLANTVMHEIGYYPDKDRTCGDPSQTPISNVVSVILNRVVCQNNDFKNVNTVYDVVTQPNQFSGIKPFLDLNVYSDYANADVYDSIKYVMEHGDTTGGALYFHSGPPNSFFQGSTVTFLFKDYAGHQFYK